MDRLSLLKQMLLLLGVAVPLAVATAWVHPRPPAWTTGEVRPGEVTVATVGQWPESPFWIDARSQREFDQGHIPGAILLNEDEWEALFFDFIGAWDGEQVIVIYCGGAQCEASHRVADRLRQDLGADAAEIWVLKGGWPAWRGQR
jgi:rhodanese-related sulfurtransferase